MKKESVEKRKIILKVNVAFSCHVCTDVANAFDKQHII